MSVVGAVPIEFRRFSGYLDPRYPLGQWFGVSVIEGDATGGTASVTIDFVASTQVSRATVLYNLEELSISREVQGSAFMRFLALNFSRPTSFAARHQYSLDIRQDAVGGGSAMDPKEAAFLPLFLGTQRDIGTTVQIAIIDGNSDGNTITMEAWGYYWSPRSVLIDGGPQRPFSRLAK